MSRRLSRPYFPIPPRRYRAKIFSQRCFVRFLYFWNRCKTPGDIRATEITITNLQSDDSGLPPGALFQHDGVVRVPQPNQPYVRGSSGTGTVGAVTVTT